jgi:hypothetical protein
MKTFVSIAFFAGSLLSACGPGGGPGDPYFIPGSGSLPDCSDPPAEDLTDTWYDNGTITIADDGCAGTTAGEMLTVCALQWRFTQTGNDVDILVDNEYRVDGRICGDTLHLRGGWWLPTEDEGFGCTYEEDTAEEVGIQAEGNTLTLVDGQLVGTLVVRGGCSASYDATFSRLGY